jgi:hypothetical protein
MQIGQQGPQELQVFDTLKLSRRLRAARYTHRTPPKTESFRAVWSLYPCLSQTKFVPNTIGGDTLWGIRGIINISIIAKAGT